MSANFDTINVVSGTLNIGSGNIYDIILSDTSGNKTVFNQNHKNIDFVVSGVDNFLYYDASTGRLGIGDSQPDASLHIVAPCANDGLKLEGTTNCPTGVRILLLHNPGVSPETGSYPATIDLAGHNSNSETIYYGQIRSKILSPATSATSGEIIFNVDHTGTLSTVFRSNTANSVLGGLNNINGYAYNVMGANNNLSGLLYIDLGSNNSGLVSSGLLLGNDIDVNGMNVICISNVGSLSGTNVLLIGNNTLVSGHTNVVVANNSNISGSNNILLGNSNTLPGNTNNIIGLFNNANISGVSGLGFGSSVSATGFNNVFLGNNTSLVGSNNSLIGSNVKVTGNNNLVYGGSSTVSGSNIVSIGNSNNPVGVTSGLFIGNDIDLVNSSKSVVMGLDNTIDNNLNNSILVGISNDTSSGSANDLVLIGQNNISSDITNSLIAGNKNNVSGTIKNNIVIGPDNYGALTSNNNIIVGALNNNTGLQISSNGTISGVSSSSNPNMNNSLLFGINNISYNSVNTTILGNKNQVSGNNLNSIGSFNNIKSTNYSQNIGNSNFILGDYTNIFGGKVTSIGSSSLINNPSKRSVYSFGDGNILFGNNEIVVSGICVGDNNDLLGLNNIVYGTNNFIGETRNPCSINSSIITINGDVRVNYTDGDRVLVVVTNPASTGNIYQRLIDEVSYDNVNGVTNIVVTENIAPLGVSYGVQNTFDGSVSSTSSVSGWVMPYQDGNDLSDPVGDPLYGDSNIVLGSNNKYLNTSGIVLGRNTNISGVKNIVIGYNISGLYNNSVQIGTSNANKIYFDDDGVVFNTGVGQNYVIFNSRLAGTTMIANLAQNRVGVNTSTPRSTVDVSGLLTTAGLRVGLSTVSGYSLIADASGNATWQFPVNLSGINSGILYRVNNKVGSGINEFIFNPISRHLTYVKPATAGGIEPEDAFTLTPSGLFINDAADDESIYNVIIRGSGIGLIDEQADYNLRVNIFKTLPQYNAVQVYNITGVSGHFYRQTVTNAMFLPTSLTGTLLAVSPTNGLLTNRNMPGNTLLFANRQSFASGNNDIKFFSENKVLTIGTTGILSQEQTSNFQGANDIYSNIILGSTPSFGTVINNAGYGQPFSVINSGEASTTNRLGMHYWTNGGILGIGVTPSTTAQSTNGGSAIPWYTHPAKLFVQGRIKTNGLQLTPNGAFPGDQSARYLRVDDDGVVQLSAINLNTQFSGVWPLYVSTPVGSRLDIGISSRRDGASTNFGASENGYALVFNGARWVNNSRGLRLYQPDYLNDNDNTIPGMILGPGGIKNSCNNTHVFAGTPFMDSTTDARYMGSNQMSRFYLKGRTIDNANTELFSNFTKNVNVSPAADNTISIQYLYNPAGGNNYDAWNGRSVWLYKAQFCGLAVPKTAGVEQSIFRGVAGTLEGAFVFYRSNDGTRVVTPLGSPAITVYKSDQLDWGANNPVYVTGITDGNVQRLGVYTRGLNDYNILWDTTIDIQQINHPSGVNIAGSI